jgi:hypothetical protein
LKPTTRTRARPGAQPVLSRRRRRDPAAAADSAADSENVLAILRGFPKEAERPRRGNPPWPLREIGQPAGRGLFEDCPKRQSAAEEAPKRAKRPLRATGQKGPLRGWPEEAGGGRLYRNRLPDGGRRRRRRLEASHGGAYVGPACAAPSRCGRMCFQDSNLMRLESVSSTV